MEPLFEPDVDDFGRARHDAAFAVRAMQFAFVHVRFVNSSLPASVRDGTLGRSASCPAHLAPAFAAHPDVERGAPIAVPADVPVDQVFEEFAEPALADMGRIPSIPLLLAINWSLPAVVR